MTEKIGFIGTGIMGSPMAMNLIKAGYGVWVYARTPARAQTLVQAGATVCRSPKAVAECADIIITMVSDTPDVEAVVLGPEGVIAGAAPGKVLVDMSTISPSAARRIAAHLGEKGVEMLDAPVSGGDIGAREGTLSIMVGGKEDVFERVWPVFNVLGSNIVLVGDHGAGQVAKTCNQVLVAQHVQAAAEALLLARACGVDPARVRSALLGGFAASRVLEVHGQRMLAHDFAPGFKLALHRKDIRIAMDTAAEHQLRLDGTELAAARINEAVEYGYGELDTSSVALLLEDRNRVKM